MGIVKTRKLSVRPKIILFSKMVQDYGNRSADICLVTQAVGQGGHSLSMCILCSVPVLSPENNYFYWMTKSLSLLNKMVLREIKIPTGRLKSQCVKVFG